MPIPTKHLLSPNKANNANNAIRANRSYKANRQIKLVLYNA